MDTSNEFLQIVLGFNGINYLDDKVLKTWFFYVLIPFEFNKPRICCNKEHFSFEYESFRNQASLSLMQMKKRFYRNYERFFIRFLGTKMLRMLSMYTRIYKWCENHVCITGCFNIIYNIYETNSLIGMEFIC